MMISRPSRRVPAVLWILTGMMLLVEAVLAAAEAGLIDLPQARWVAISVGGFFDSSFERALAGGGTDAQLLWSLVTYTMLHGGWMHVVLNAVAFLAFGNIVCQQIGTLRFLIFYAVSAAAGALALGIISDFPGPLIGASGVVFGLLGMLTSWESSIRRRRHESQKPIMARIGGLIALNLLLFVFAEIGLDAKLGWEAHLGGFVAGWVLAYAFRPPVLRYAASRPVRG